MSDYSVTDYHVRLTAIVLTVACGETAEIKTHLFKMHLQDALF